MEIENRMSPAEAKMRILAEWRTWIGHKEAADSHTGQDATAFFEHLGKTYPDLLVFESSEDKLNIVKRWLTDAGLIKV
jgi:hypothetical protein